MSVLIAVLVALAAVILTWVLSLATGDHSWVDRYWSIAPVIYAWIFAGAALIAGKADARVIIMAALATAWGVRLTFNFARKGGYNGVEDYRWPILRERMSARQFGWFNFLFISLFQNAVLVLIALPVWVAASAAPSPLTPWDLILASLFVAALIGETMSDQQQWNFHRFKKIQGEQGISVTPGFLHTGLWRFSRHPNYFFELSQWWLLYLFGIVAISVSGQPIVVGAMITVSGIGAVLLTAVFAGSTKFTESLSSQKYPEYRDYQRTTSAVIPFVPLRGGFAGDGAF